MGLACLAMSGDNNGVEQMEDRRAEKQGGLFKSEEGSLGTSDCIFL